MDLRARSRPIDGLMEDAATAEISRMQLWQWLHHGADVTLQEGGTRVFDAAWFSDLMQAEVARLLAEFGPNGFHARHFASAIRILNDAVLAETPPISSPCRPTTCSTRSINSRTQKPRQPGAAPAACSN